MNGPALSAAIVGGGIGGLTAALSLLEAGVRVRVYEQAPALTEIGAGLQLSPNCSRVLHHVGLGQALARVGVRPDALESRGWQDGALLGSYPVNGEPLQFGAPHYLVYRPDLLNVLIGAMPDGVVRLGHRVTGVHQDSESATVLFSGGGSATADFVIGADGIHSVIRAALFGADAPTFSGTVAYRGLLPAAKVAGLRIPNTSTKWWGPAPEHHLVHYHIGGGHIGGGHIGGGSLVNVVGVVPEDWHTESWTARGQVPDFVAAFADFHPPVPELVGAVEEVYKFAIYDRPPLDEWTAGRVSLLGDASHPMVPFMAQGAAMAIEDAAILAGCVSRHGADVRRSLARYAQVRQERTERMQLGSRADTSGTWGSREWVYGYDPYAESLL
ncbi:MAG: FAD-dependent monooxygenase [Streptosporangiaceae bacterium]